MANWKQRLFQLFTRRQTVKVCMHRGSRSMTTVSLVATPPNVTEVDVRAGAVELALILQGAATWNFVDSVRGCSLVAGTSTLVVSHAQQLHPHELRLRLAPMPTFDPRTDTPLSITVSHLCGSSLLRLDQATPCVASADSGPPLLTTHLTVLSGGSPPGRPGAPRIVPLNSYNAVGVQWETPRAGAKPDGYVWVEPGQPPWPIELSGNTSHGADDRLLAVLHGFGRGTTLLPGSVAGVSAGGYSQPSVAWVGGVFGEPAPPQDVTLMYVAQAPGTSLQLTWRLPEATWGGGFPMRHHRLTLWTTDDDEQVVASSLRVALDEPDSGEPRTESEAAALAAALTEAAADETTGTEASEAPAATSENAADEVHVDVRADGEFALLLEGLRPGSRYAAQLVAVNSAGDESAAPALCGGRAEAADRSACAPEASVPVSTVSWCGYSEEQLERCSRLVVAIAVVVPLVCAAALGYCLWRRMRRRCCRRATTTASVPDTTDGTALPVAQALPPQGDAGGASERQHGHAPARWNGRWLRAATRPIWRVFVPGPQDLAQRECDDAADAMPTERGAAKTAPKETSPQLEPTTEEPATLSV